MKIKPIKDLRDTNKISKEAHLDDEPIFITKNGYQDLVVLTQKRYDKITSNKTFEHEASSFYKQARKIDISSQSKVELGYVRVASSTIEISIANVPENVRRIKEKIDYALENKVSLILFHELSLSGYTCGDLFLNDDLLNDTLDGIKELKAYSLSKPIIIVVGAALLKDSNLYNCAVTLFDGKILGITPKSFIPNYNEFYEARYFSTFPNSVSTIFIDGEEVPFGTNIIYRNEKYLPFSFSCEICEDLWVPNSPSISHCLHGANIILNLSASNEIVDKNEYRRELVRNTSSRLLCGYIYSSCGRGESSQDLIFSGHNLIAECGRIFKETKLFDNETIIGEIDLDKIIKERKRQTTYNNIFDSSYETVYFSLDLKDVTELKRHITSSPFAPTNATERQARCNIILRMQSESLLQRMKHIHCTKLVVGLSGGLDSTLALLVSYEALKLNNIDPVNLTAITLPSFGTTDLTHSNAYILAKKLGCTFLDININAAVKQHFKDIHHDESIHNTAYENAQARERTQILMDYANDHNAIMVGTGDLSELCLGWTTYCGDHMSMYGVNAGVPKTLVKFLVEEYAYENQDVKDVLLSIVKTPISPELIPPTKDNKIQQKTEDFVGPYELVDFFIYHFLRHNYSIKKIAFLTTQAFGSKYSNEEIKKWLTSFIKRFFSAQFKRSCLPDGIKLGTVGVSPRGDLRMPSDASYQAFLDECNKL